MKIKLTESGKKLREYLNKKETGIYSNEHLLLNELSSILWKDKDKLHIKFKKFVNPKVSEILVSFYRNKVITYKK